VYPCFPAARRAPRSERQRVEGRVRSRQPALHALALQQPERAGAFAVVDRLPEAGVARIDLAHGGVVQAGQGDHAGAVRGRLAERLRAEQQREVVAAAVVLHHDVVGLVAEGIDQRAEQVARVLAVVEHMPEVDRHAELGEDVEEVRILDPACQRRQRLRCEVDDHALLRTRLEAVDHRVQALVAVDHHRRGEALVEAGEGAVRSIGVEAHEGLAVIDEVLREDPGSDGLADTAFFAADEVEGAHEVAGKEWSEEAWGILGVMPSNPA
jgi:hypothetical protein